MSSAEGGLNIWKADSQALGAGLIPPIGDRYFVVFLNHRRLLIDAKDVKSLAWKRLPRKMKKRLYGAR
jgi:hypothetical protein